MTKPGTEKRGGDRAWFDGGRENMFAGCIILGATLAEGQRAYSDGQGPGAFGAYP